MSLDQIIQSRRSFFPAQFSGEKLPDSLIHRMFENANWAPTHLHTEPWRFKVYKDDSLLELMKFMAGLYREITLPEHFSQAKFDKYTQANTRASHVIAIGMHRHELQGLPECEEVAAVAMAVQNMWLTLSSEPGAGGYWSTGSMVYTPQMAQFLDFQSPVSCLGLFYIGSIDQSKPHAEGKRKPIEEKVIWV